MKFRLPLGDPSKPLWPWLWALALSWSWLLPNHYRPVTTFHSEAWASACCLLSAAIVGWQSNASIHLRSPSALLLAAAASVWIQHALGYQPFLGKVWLISGFFALAAVSFMSAGQWQRWRPYQMLDMLFLAFGVAAILSVGLQLDQWLQLESFEIWGMGGGDTRPYANFGQPNLLSTFLIWGLLALLWGAERGYLGSRTALLAALFLLFGIALTQSRAGWLSLGLVVAGIWLRKGKWRISGLHWIALLLVAYMAVCVLILASLSAFLQSPVPPQLNGRLALGGELRLRAWAVLLDAAWQRPWFGYGWDRVELAQLSVATAHPPLGWIFSHAHNLLLDLVLAVGLPLGLLFAGVLSAWLFFRIRLLCDGFDSVMLMVIGVVALHAMFELPLHHAHFLFPACLVAGALTEKQAPARSGWVISKWFYWPVLLALSTGFSVAVSDYLRVESSFQKLRFEWARIGKLPIGRPPEVLMLDQYRDLIAFHRFAPSKNMDPAQIAWMHNVALTFPAPAMMTSYAKALALNGDPAGASQRIRQMCLTNDPVQCELGKRVWETEALSEPALALVEWPSAPQD